MAGPNLSISVFSSFSFAPDALAYLLYVLIICLYSDGFFNYDSSVICIGLDFNFIVSWRIESSIFVYLH